MCADAGAPRLDTTAAECWGSRQTAQGIESMIDDIDSGKNILSSLCLVRMLFISAKNTLSPSTEPLTFSFLPRRSGQGESIRSPPVFSWPNYQNDKVPWQPLNGPRYAPSCRGAIFISGGWWMSNKKGFGVEKQSGRSASEMCSTMWRESFQM